MKSTDMLRNFPSVAEMLDSPPLKRLVRKVSRSSVVVGVRSVLADVRDEMQRSAAQAEPPSIVELAERIARCVLLGEIGPRPVINATGILLHHELGQAPLADSAVEAMLAVTRNYVARSYTTRDAGALVADVAEGQLPRGREIGQLLAALSGAEAGFVVNSHASAIVLVLAALASGKEALIARAQLGENEAGDRWTDLARAAGATLCEVGATNVFTVADYQRAINPATAAIVYVSRGCFRVIGHQQAAALEELVPLGREHELPVVDVMQSAALIDLTPFGLAKQPSFADSVDSGADLVVADGAGLLGGPHCGLIVGRTELIERLAAHPLARALTLDLPTAAAMEATLRLYRDPAQAQQSIPFLQLLATPVENLKNRAARLADQLRTIPEVVSAAAVESTAHLCSRRFPEESLASWSVALTPTSTAEGRSAQQLAAALRKGSQRTGIPGVVARVDGEKIYLDLRSVLPRQDSDLVAAVLGLSGAPHDPQNSEQRT